MDIKQFISEHLPMIVNYALVIIAYILYFIACNIVRKSKISLKTLFTERTDAINTGNRMLRADVEEDLKQAKAALAEAQAKYEMVDSRLTKAEKMIAALIDEEVKDAVSNNGTVAESVQTY